MVWYLIGPIAVHVNPGLSSSHRSKIRDYAKQRKGMLLLSSKHTLPKRIWKPRCIRNWQIKIDRQCWNCDVGVFQSILILIIIDYDVHFYLKLGTDPHPLFAPQNEQYIRAKLPSKLRNIMLLMIGYHMTALPTKLLSESLCTEKPFLKKNLITIFYELYPTFWDF